MQWFKELEWNCPGIPMGRKESKLNIIDYRINYNEEDSRI